MRHITHPERTLLSFLEGDSQRVADENHINVQTARKLVKRTLKALGYNTDDWRGQVGHQRREGIKEELRR